LDFIEENPELKQIVEQLEGGFFTPDQPEALKDLANMLRCHDRFYVCADFADYIKCQELVSKTYQVGRGDRAGWGQWRFDGQDQDKWLKMCLFNISSSGKFSTDRTIAEYAKHIWGIQPGLIQLPPPYETEDEQNPASDGF
jgi:starch phosphorylase